MATDVKIWPSILQQSKWCCGFFDFGKHDGFAFFNCGIVERPDGIWLIARRSKNERRIKIGFNDMVAIRLTSDYKPAQIVPIMTQKHFDREHFEDPRVIYHNGLTYISACNFVVVNDGRGWTGAHQTLNIIRSTVWNRFWQVDTRIDPIYRNNGARIGKDNGMEKNWLWFFHNDQLHMVYQADPHIVARFTLDGVFDTEYKTEPEHPIKWDYGIIRGGTPPVRIGSEYLTFFHSSLPTNDKFHRRYYMGAYAFEAKEPFRITRITPEPLLAGSQQDKWGEGKPLVVFPCGSRYKDGTWLVTMGINDIESAWIEIPHVEVEKRLMSLTPRGVVEKLVDKFRPKEKVYAHG
jgi:predicted GH43/DUF377 family glycosyl hydrolase